jgi:hypothetical protein
VVAVGVVSTEQKPLSIACFYRESIARSAFDWNRDHMSKSRKQRTNNMNYGTSLWHLIIRSTKGGDGVHSRDVLVHTTCVEGCRVSFAPESKASGEQPDEASNGRGLDLECSEREICLGFILGQWGFFFLPVTAGAKSVVGLEH